MILMIMSSIMMISMMMNALIASRAYRTSQSIDFVLKNNVDASNHDSFDSM